VLPFALFCAFVLLGVVVLSVALGLRPPPSLYRRGRRDHDRPSIGSCILFLLGSKYDGVLPVQWAVAE